MSLSLQVQHDRAAGFRLLTGCGVEIGAFHGPASLPKAANVTYVDAMTREEALRLFPEVPAEKVVRPTVIADLDKEGLSRFADESQDFVILCHVLEHLANPIGAIAEIFRILKRGGRAAIAIPDKRFTFDVRRGLTPFEHLWRDYLDGVTESSDDHYLDFLAGVTAVMGLPPHDRQSHIDWARRRREHAHV